MAVDVLNKELEGHFDSALGTFVFNRTVLQRTDCEQYRSMADISEGLLFKSKLGELSLLHYTRENDTIAITLDQQTTSCGRAMYRTGIPNVQVLLLEAEEEFLNTKHLKVSDMEEEILIESELRGALNSIEFLLDNLYQNLNERACQMTRKDIMMSQALLKANLEILHDRKGRTLF